MSKGIVQIKSISIFLVQILCGVKNQMLKLLSSNSQVFFVSRKSYSDPSLIQLCLKGNDKSKLVSKRVVQCGS